MVAQTAAAGVLILAACAAGIIHAWWRAQTDATRRRITEWLTYHSPELVLGAVVLAGIIVLVVIANNATI